MGSRSYYPARDPYFGHNSAETTPMGCYAQTPTTERGCYLLSPSPDLHASMPYGPVNDMKLVLTLEPHHDMPPPYSYPISPVKSETPEPCRPFTLDIKIVSSKNNHYKCLWPECKAAFQRREHLKRHEKKHTGEKPFHCPYVDVCNRAFSRSDNMNTHCKTHLKGRNSGGRNRQTSLREIVM